MNNCKNTKIQIHREKNMSIQSLLMQIDSQKLNTDGLKKPMLCSCMGIDRCILHNLNEQLYVWLLESSKVT